MSTISPVSPSTHTNTAGSTAPPPAGDASAAARDTTTEQADRFEASTTRKQRRAAERALARTGIAPGKVDGKIKPRTRRALRRFQKARGLEQSGQLDRPTYRALMKMSKRLRTKRGRRVDVPGQQSRRIRDAEKRLRRLGYDVGKADGLFTRKTAQAARAFKRDQKEIDNQAGVIGEKARTSLRREQRRIGHKPYRARVKDTAARRRRARVVEREVRKRHDGERGIGRGMRGPAVRTVQRHLRAAGYNPKRTGGVFDQRTEGMVKEFQRRKGLEPTGRVDWKTWQQLRKAQMESSGPASPKQRVGERSKAVKKTEQLLHKLGYKPGPVDGLYTQQTQKAVDRFRRARGLGHRGKGVGPHMLKKLKRASSGAGQGKKFADFYRNNYGRVHAEALRFWPNSYGCAAHASTALKMAGYPVRQVLLTNDVESQLKAQGWQRITDMSKLKPGDVVFTDKATSNVSGTYSHVFVFQKYAGGGDAYVSDNYGGYFRRNIGPGRYSRSVVAYRPRR